MAHHSCVYRGMFLCWLGFAVPLSAGAQSFHGLYAGGELGGTMASVNQTLLNNVNLDVVPGGTFQSSSPFRLDDSMVRNAAAGALVAGYGQSFEKFYLGGELSLSSGYYKMTNSSNTGLSRLIGTFGNVTIASAESMDTQVNLSPVQFGVMLRPGILLSPTSLLYGRIGTSFATVHYYTHLVAIKKIDQNPPVLNFPVTMQSRQDAHRAALQLGLGLEQAVNDRLTVRLDYLFSSYGRINQTTAQSSTIDPIVLNATGSQSARIYTQSMMLGLMYYFNP
jgi:opacity protein-like surface antigen